MVSSLLYPTLQRYLCTVFAVQIIVIKLGSCLLLAHRLCTKLFSWGPRRAYLSFYLFTCWLIISHNPSQGNLCCVSSTVFIWDIKWKDSASYLPRYTYCPFWSHSYLCKMKLISNLIKCHRLKIHFPVQRDGMLASSEILHHIVCLGFWLSFSPR